MNKLNPKEVFQNADIPVLIIRGNKNVIALFIHHHFKNSLESSSLLPGLKYTDVRTVLKKEDKIGKVN